MLGRRVGVDATALFRDDPTGVDRAARGWVSALAGVRPQWQLELVGWRGTTDARHPLDLPPGRANVHAAVLPRYGYRLAELARVPMPLDALARVDADAWFFPDFVRLPLAHRRPSVTVVHDLSFRIAERFSHRMHRAFLARQVKRALRLGTVATVSAAVAEELAVAFDVPRGRIEVVPNAVDHDRFAPQPPELVADVTARLGLDRPYVLSVGALHARKNLTRLIHAYAAIGERAAGVDLVLAGSTNRYSGEVLDAVAAYRGPGRVRHLGPLPDAALPALYTGAEVAATPSVYEGFGLPVLEAMACGTPVLTSPGGALAEVGGAAAEYADPHDVAAIATGLRRLLDEPGLRAERREAGLRRAGDFSWERSAQTLAQVIEAATAGFPR